MILFCYVVKSEAPHHAKMWRSLKMETTTTPDEDFSSESVINPLNCKRMQLKAVRWRSEAGSETEVDISVFTKQEGDAESEAAAPRRTAQAQAARDARKGIRGADTSEEMLMAEARMPDKDDCGTNTQETYVYNTDGSMLEEKVPDEKYKAMTSFKYRREPAETAADEWKFEKSNGGPQKPEMGQCYGKESTSQEIITTRVSVELGVITTHQRNEMTGQEVATPAIVLCSVDVEPCQSRVVEVSEVLTDSICCNGIGGAGSFVLGKKHRNPLHPLASIAHPPFSPDPFAKKQELPDRKRTSHSAAIRKRRRRKAAAKRRRRRRLTGSRDRSRRRRRRKRTRPMRTGWRTSSTGFPTTSTTSSTGSPTGKRLQRK